MTKLKLISIICLFAAMVFGCDSQSKFFTENPEFLLYYGSGETTVSNIRFNCLLKAKKSTNEVMLEITTTNLSEETRIVNLQEGVIAHRNYRSFPVKVSRESFSIGPGETAIDTLTFDPINNSFLHRFAGINGDLGTIYTFYPGEMISHSSENRILFQVEPTEFMDYLHEYGKDSLLTIWGINESDHNYKISLSSNMDTVLNYYQNLSSKDLENGTKLIQNSERPNFQITSNEILVGGIILRIKAYEIDREIKIRARIVNHQSLPLDLNLNKFYLQINGEQVKPISINADRNLDQLKLQKGQRTNVELVYDIDLDNNDLKFLPYLSLAGMNFNLFNAIPLKQLEVPVAIETFADS